MKYDQKQHPLLLGILYATLIYGSIVCAVLYAISIVVATVLMIPMCILFIFVLISQMKNISFAKKEEDVDYCLKTYFIYKYITMPVELICAGIIGASIFVIFGMIIHWPKEDLIAAFFALFFAMIIYMIIVIIPYVLIVFAVIGLPCFISIEYVLGITQKKIRYIFCGKNDTFFIADNTGVGYYRRTVYKHKVLE